MNNYGVMKTISAHIIVLWLLITYDLTKFFIAENA
jgi:hypothetical protein